MAGWVTIVGSVLVVVGLFDTVANLRSIETRERVQRMLSEPPLDGTGMTVDRWLSIVHSVSLVGAAAASAAAILGFYVLRRNHGARVALTLVAVPLFVTGLVTSGFLTTLVAVSVLMLWTKPARDWFAGRPWQVATPSGGTPFSARPHDTRPAADERREPPRAEPPPAPQPGPWQAVPKPEDQERSFAPTAAGRPHQGFGAQGARPAFPTGRPAALVQACVLTWVFAGLVLVACLVTTLGFVTQPDLFREAYEQNPMAADAGIGMAELKRMMYVLFGMLALWSVAAIALAVLAFLGRDWARIALLVSAASAGLFFLLATFSAGAAGLAMIVPTVACVATVVLLLRPEVTAWIRARSSR